MAFFLLYLFVSVVLSDRFCSLNFCNYIAIVFLFFLMSLLTTFGEIQKNAITSTELESTYLNGSEIELTKISLVGLGLTDL